MNIKEYGELVDELNESLEGNKFVENQGLCFIYSTNGYIDVISFGEQVIFCSEVDSTYSCEKERELTVKEVVIRNFKDYVKALKTIKLKK